MSEQDIVSCGACSAKLRISSTLSGKIRCPKCKSPIDVQSHSRVSVSARVDDSPTPASADVVQVICDGCKKKLKIPGTLSGRKLRCPHCKTTLGNTVGQAIRISDPPLISAIQPVTAHAGKPVKDASPVPSSYSRPAAQDHFGSVPVAGYAPRVAPIQASPTMTPSNYAATVNQPNPGTATSHGSSEIFGIFGSHVTTPPVSQVGLWTMVAFGGSLIGSFVPIFNFFLSFAVILAVLPSLFICHVWIAIIAFQEDLLPGILNLFLPFYTIYYTFSRWGKCWQPATLTWIGMGIFGGWIFGILIVFFVPLLFVILFG